jgi:hypothetical protein
MSLWTLLQAVLLLANGAAVLNNERFLERRGWGFSTMGRAGHSLKASIIGGIHAAQYFRSLLMVLNVVVIAVKVVFG